MFEPEKILYQVWQQDIPADWHAYPRGRLRIWMVGCVLALVIIVAALLPLPIAPGFWLHNSAPFIGSLLLAIVFGSLCLVFGARQGLDFPISNHPDSVLVVMPEGVVEFINTQVPIYTLPFSEIDALKRHQRGDKAWLEVISNDGSEAEWTPRTIFGSKRKGFTYEVIFARIIEAYERYQVGGIKDMVDEDSASIG